jgi:hypothetical protein
MLSGAIAPASLACQASFMALSLIPAFAESRYLDRGVCTCQRAVIPVCREAVSGTAGTSAPALRWQATAARGRVISSKIFAKINIVLL